MNDLNPIHTSHIGRVTVGIIISASELVPEQITLATGIQPDSTGKRGDERRNPRGQVLSLRNEGYWEVTSNEKLISKDVNDHFAYLLNMLIPHQESILEIVRNVNGEVYLVVDQFDSWGSATIEFPIHRPTSAGSAAEGSQWRARFAPPLDQSPTRARALEGR